MIQLDNLRGLMEGEDCVVVGAGPSAESHVSLPGDWTGKPILTLPELMYGQLWTIVCNRTVKFSSPDFAVCVEPKRDKIWETVAESSPFLIFSHIDRPHPRCVLINSKDVGEWLGGPFEDFEDYEGSTPLRLGQSPFYAAAVAILLGFETIGLIGVDMTADRYDDLEVDRANKQYERLAKVAGWNGSRLINLSSDSRLTLERGEWSEIRTK